MRQTEVNCLNQILLSTATIRLDRNNQYLYQILEKIEDLVSQYRMEKVKNHLQNDDFLFSLPIDEE